MEYKDQVVSSPKWHLFLKNRGLLILFILSLYFLLSAMLKLALNITLPFGLHSIAGFVYVSGISILIYSSFLFLNLMYRAFISYILFKAYKEYREDDKKGVKTWLFFLRFKMILIWISTAVTLIYFVNDSIAIEDLLENMFGTFVSPVFGRRYFRFLPVIIFTAVGLFVTFFYRFNKKYYQNGISSLVAAADQNVQPAKVEESRSEIENAAPKKKFMSFNKEKEKAEKFEEPHIEESNTVIPEQKAENIVETEHVGIDDKEPETEMAVKMLPINDEPANPWIDEPIPGTKDNDFVIDVKTMMFCPYCGTKITDPNAKVCSHCGKQIR